MKKKTLSRIMLTLLLIGMLTPAFNIQLARAYVNVISGWLTFPVTFDGKMTTVEEWSDTTHVDITLLEWHVGPGTASARVWIKNDDTWLYMLYRVEWPAEDTDPFDGAFIEYFWDWIGEPPPLWNHSDFSFIEFDNATFDLYGWNETGWYNDVDPSRPGENNVEGAATHDGTYYWFEFRKELNSGDGYDWGFTLGQVIETGDLLVGVWDESTKTPYEEYISLHLARGEPSITIGTTYKITVLDPAKCYDFCTWELFHNIGEGLLKYKLGTTELEYGIAENYTVSPDGLNYTFKLREGMHFTDGEPLNASAVKWSVDRVISLDLDPAFLVSIHVDSVEVVDTLTVRFVLRKAFSYFPALVATTPYFPVSSKSYPANETAEPTVGHYGPYKIKSWTRDVELVLEANPDYYGAQPKSEYAVIKFFPNATIMRQALEDGEIDIAWRTLPLTDIVDLRENPNFNVVENPTSLIRYIVLRCNMTPFDDMRLRRAVAASINRTRICTEAWLGTVEPLYSMVPKEMWTHIDAFKEEYGTRNLTLARELLTDAGYNETSKFEFDLWYSPTHYGAPEADAGAIIKSDLEETGMMDVTLKSAEWATYVGNIRAGVMPIFLLGWYPDYVDPDDYLTPFLHSVRSPDLGVFYNNTVMDTILDDAMVEQNITRRTELYEDAQRLLAEEAPLVPFFQGTFHAVARPNIGGIYLSPTMFLPYYTIYARSPRVYVDPLISYAGVGETFSINVSVADVSNLYGFEFKLGYNTIFLDAVDVVVQPFLDEPTYVFREEINDEYNATFGFVWVSVTSQYPAEGVYGSGALATVTFQVMGLGGCVLDLYDTKMSDPDGFPIDHSVEAGYYESGMTRVVSTESTNASNMPSLAVDSTGNVHIAWYDYTNYAGSGTDVDVFYKRYVPSSGWTITEVVSNESTNDSYRPSLAVGLDGTVHIAWDDWTQIINGYDSGTDNDVFYKRYVPGTGWTNTEVVSTESTGASSNPSLAVGSDGTIHIAWHDATEYGVSGTDVDVFYKRYVPSSGWTITEVVSNESTGASYNPSLAVDYSGNVHIAWEDYTDYAGCGSDRDIFYKRYEVGGNWTSTEVVSTNSTENSFGPYLAVDSTRNVHVAWDDDIDYPGSGTDRDIFYRRFVAGSGWTSIEVVSTESTNASVAPSLAVDSSGKVHVAWYDYTNYTGCGTDTDIFYKRYEAGSGWTNTHVVSTESTGNSYYPSLAVDLSRNVHITWQDNTDYAGCGADADIFYRYLRVHSTQYPWSMFRHNLRNTGYTESPAPNTNQTLWNYTTGSAVFSSPAVADGMVFVGSNDSNVYALDQHTGAHIWNYTTGSDVQSSPAVADGMLFVGSDDGKVYALNQYTGAHIWNHTTGGSVFSSPAVADGKVYVGSTDGKIYCLDAQTGKHIWNHTTGWSVNSSPAVADGKVYVGSHDGKVYCLDAYNGTSTWNYTIGWLVGPSPAVADGKVFVGSFDGKVYCLDASTGAHIWNYTTGGAVSSSAVADGKVYVGSTDGKIYCLDAQTGKHIWNHTTGGWVESSPAVADGKVYVGSHDGKVYCLDASTKDFKWSYTTGSDVRSSPAVADGMLFVGSDDGKIYAFGNIVRVPEDFPDPLEAALHARPKAAILVGPGIYPRPVVVDKPLDFIGKKGSPGPTQPGGGSGTAVTILPEGSGSSYHGFVITNWDQGVLINNASDCKIYDNTMTLMDYDGIAVEGDNAANNTIYSNTFQQNTIAINLNESSTSNTIYNNTISSNTIGLNLLESGGNTIYANTITENEVGIKTSNSNNNTIYWNSFINNDFPAVSNPSLNTWHHGYPDGGNYWSNFKDRYPYVKDVHRGPNQDETGSDGIWDGPHEIDGNNIDRYPLVKPFSPHDIGITNVTTSKTIIGQGYDLSITVKILNYGTHDEAFAVTAYANTTIMAKQTITLTTRNSTTVTLTWSTTGVPYGNYTISANATIVPGETDTTDNTYPNGWVLVTCKGDFGGGLPPAWWAFDDQCNYQDLSLFREAYLYSPQPPLPAPQLLADLGSGLPPTWWAFDGQCNYQDLALFREAYLA